MLPRSINSVAAASAPSQQHQLRRSSISFVAAASGSAPSQQQQQATAVSRDDEWSTGAFLFKVTVYLEPPLDASIVVIILQLSRILYIYCMRKSYWVSLIVFVTL